MKSLNKDVKQYFSSVPAERKEMIIQLHNLILALYPDAQVDMSYKMPTYKAQDGWLALANQKNYVSLYTCGAHHLADFKKKYPTIKTGRGCINFKNRDTLPVTALTKVIKNAIEHP